MRPPKLIRRWKRKIKRYTNRYGYHPLRSIVRERERMKFVHLGMRLARRKEPKSTLEVALQQQKPDPLKSPAYIEQIRTQEMTAINAEQAKELQRYIDSHQPQPGPYEPPGARTDAISLERMRNAYHKARLLPIDSLEMEAMIVTEKRKVV